MITLKSFKSVTAALVLFFLLSASGSAQQPKGNSNLDEKVKSFLNDHSRQWYDMNVPAADGQLLYDIIVKEQL